MHLWKDNLNIMNISYYGFNEGKLLTDQTIGIYMVNEAYHRILKKHESELIKKQESIISNLKNTFAEDLKKMSKQYNLVTDRLKSIETQLKKEEDNAISKRKKSKNS